MKPRKVFVQRIVWISITSLSFLNYMTTHVVRMFFSTCYPAEFFVQSALVQLKALGSGRGQFQTFIPHGHRQTSRAKRCQFVGGNACRRKTHGRWDKGFLWFSTKVDWICKKNYELKFHNMTQSLKELQCAKYNLWPPLKGWLRG